MIEIYIYFLKSIFVSLLSSMIIFWQLNSYRYLDIISFSFFLFTRVSVPVFKTPVP